jgi:hypothetical protein
MATEPNVDRRAIEARWDPYEGVYDAVSPSGDLDWYSCDGRVWLDTRTSALCEGPAFKATSIRLIGGPRNGQTVH